MLAPTILGFTAKEMSQLHSRLRGWVTETLHGRQGAAPPSNTHQQTDTSHTLYLAQSMAKTHQPF